MAGLSTMRGPCRSWCCSSNRARAPARAAHAALRSPVSCFASTFGKHQLPQALEQRQQQQVAISQASQQQLPKQAADSAEQQSLTSEVAGWTGQAGAQVSLAVALALLAVSISSEPASAADGMQQHHSSIQPMLNIAEGEEFWGNVAKYGRYFVTVMLGTGYVMVQPVLQAFKRPVTAVAAIVGIGGGFILLKLVLNAMLGVQEPFDYEPGSIVPYS